MASVLGGIPRKTEAMDTSWDMGDNESEFIRKPEFWASLLVG